MIYQDKKSKSDLFVFIFGTVVSKNLVTHIYILYNICMLFGLFVLNSQVR